MRTSTRPGSLRRAAVLLTSTGLVLAACGNADDSADGSVVAVAGAWARTSAMGADVGVVYLSVTSPVDDTIVSVSVDPTVAASAELHETVTAASTATTMAMGPDTTVGTGADTAMPMGEMTMQPVESIELPAGTTVVLAPGGYHIMLFDLAAPLEVGATVSITLTFATAGEIVVDVPVRDEAP